MKYDVIQQLKAKEALPVEHSCRALEASRSGYYAASGRSYVSRRLKAALVGQGHRIGLHRVRTLMRRYALKPVWKRKFTATTDSRHNLPMSENVLDRCFQVDKPNLAWVSDISYIRTRSGWLYLAAVLDLHSRKLVGWAMAPNMPAELICTALQMAICQRVPESGLIVHSDRGRQYASEQHRVLLTKHGLVGSMSRKGNCWNNGVPRRLPEGQSPSGSYAA